MNIFCRKKNFVGIMILSCAVVGFVDAMQILLPEEINTIKRGLCHMSEPPAWSKHSKLRTNRKDMVAIITTAYFIAQSLRAQVFNEGDDAKNVQIRSWLNGVVEEKKQQLRLRCQDLAREQSRSNSDISDLEHAFSNLNNWGLILYNDLVADKKGRHIASGTPIDGTAEVHLTHELWCRNIDWELLDPLSIPLAAVSIAELERCHLIFQREAEVCATQVGCPENKHDGCCTIQ